MADGSNYNYSIVNVVVNGVAVTVIDKGDGTYTVKFDSRGGSEIPPQTVQYGEKIIQPDDPLREDYQFEQWYADIDLTDEWDFENDVVQNNMTLYAKWSEKTEETGVSDSDGKWKKYYWVLLLLLILSLILIIYLKHKQDKRK